MDGGLRTGWSGADVDARRGGANIGDESGGMEGCGGRDGEMEEERCRECLDKDGWFHLD